MKLVQENEKKVKSLDGKEKSILIKEEVDYEITGYEFPNEKPSTQEDYNYDANWLVDKITYNGESFSTAGILVGELQHLVSEMKKVINGEKNKFELSPIEIGVFFQLEKIENKYLFSFSFVRPAKEGMKKISQLFDKKGILEKVHELEEFLIKYPER